MNANEFGKRRITLPGVKALEQEPVEFDGSIMPDVPRVPENNGVKTYRMTASCNRAMTLLFNLATGGNK